MLSYMGIFRRKFIWSNSQAMLLRGTKVCHLKKAIYGLNQSPRVQFEKLNLSISGIGFHRCHSDHSVFVRRIKSGIVVLAVYVDDIVLTGSDSAGLLETKKHLKRHSVTKDMGCLKYFLGIEILHKNIIYFFPSENMLWIFLRKLAFWDASLLSLQWKPM